MGFADYADLLGSIIESAEDEAPENAGSAGDAPPGMEASGMETSGMATGGMVASGAATDGVPAPDGGISNGEQATANQAGTEQAGVEQEGAEQTAEQTARYYKDSTYALVSTVAYLIGVSKSVFENEHEPPKLEAYERLDADKSARIIRNLCRLRTAVERNFKRINDIMKSEYRGLASMPECVPIECINQLASDGIFIKSNQKPGQHIIDFNRNISDRINNCKDLFPIWITWEYIKNIFIMPNGLTENGTRDAAEAYYAHKSWYPYQVYINWPPSDEGNILFNDKKFTTLLYQWNNDSFTDNSKVSDASELTKSNIYEFIEASQKTVFVVDCENSDPYKLCAALRNLNAKFLRKITKIILFDDVNASTGWRMLEAFTNITVEHILIERIKSNKSLVDIKLTAETCKEFYQNNVDSFVIVSSDSDYWGLITSVRKQGAKFLVMLEYEKTGPDIKNALTGESIFYCYIDDFYTGNSNDIKISALLKELRLYLERSVCVNVFEMMEAALRATRIEMPPHEEKQFINKYIKPMQIAIDDSGNVKFQIRAK